MFFNQNTLAKMSQCIFFLNTVELVIAQLVFPLYPFQGKETEGAHSEDLNCTQ